MTPSVYVSELSTGAAIQGVATSITLFAGRTATGPAGAPTLVTGLGSFVSQFGAVSAGLPLTLAVRDFFTNGGTSAIIMRIGADSPLSEADWLNGVNAVSPDQAFNVFCVTPDVLGEDVPLSVIEAVTTLCVTREAMAILPPPAAWQAAFEAGQCSQISADSFPGLPLQSRFASAAYFPDILVPHPDTAQPIAHPPCGAAAGLWAATDVAEGVWHAPAGLTAGLMGILGVAADLTDADQGEFNGNGVNGVRQFPHYGPVLWGARTLGGILGETDVRRYIAGGRLMAYIRQSLTQGLAWTVFEPNDAALWSAVTQSVSQFLNELWAAGGLVGMSAADAYMVTCDASNNPSHSVAQGVLNVTVGVAIQSPAEFTIINLILVVAAAS